MKQIEILILIIFFVSSTNAQNTPSKNLKGLYHKLDQNNAAGINFLIEGKVGPKIL